MLFVLSPAKTLDYESPLKTLDHTLPQFMPEATELVDVLKRKSRMDIAQLMNLSEALSELNVARYRSWSPDFNAAHARPALFTFAGDVYEGLNALSLTTPQLKWAQNHVRILSGLYGVLRPLDGMQAYRLEMGTSLVTKRGKNLYQFWGDRIAQALDQALVNDPSATVVNLASQEYFKAVSRKALQAQVVSCEFEDHQAGKYKVIGFYAKRARGLMARYAITHRAKTVDALRGFDSEGYAYAPEVSSAERLVFRRQLAGS